MKQAWVILTKRCGTDVRAPTEKQLADALNELYVDHTHGATSDGDDEHESASLRFGYDDGLMYVVEIMSSGTVTFEEWADQDFEVELAPPKRMLSVPKAQALELWLWLWHRQVSKIRSQPWTVIP
jgi:hypothetical protein